jgi:hypothetical protein
MLLEGYPMLSGSDRANDGVEQTSKLGLRWVVPIEVISKFGRNICNTDEVASEPLRRESHQTFSTRRALQMAHKESIPSLEKNINEDAINSNRVQAKSLETVPDPFDPASLRLSGDFSGSLGVKKAILSIPVRKPDKAWFVRVHPSIDYSIDTCVIELKEDRETYLVSQELWSDLVGEATFSPRALFSAMNKQGVLFVWPIRLPGTDGKLDEWSRTALEAAKMAKDQWCRVTANMSLGAYEVHYAIGELGEPDWPEIPFKDILRITFKDRFITSLDHPVLRKLRGEV